MKVAHLENGETIEDIGDEIKDLRLYGELTKNAVNGIKVKGIQNLDLSNITNTELPESAFDRFMSLVSVILPKNIITIPVECFYKCEALEEVKASDSVNLVSIESSAFYCCYELKTIILPDSVQYINKRAFYQCKMLKTIRLSRTLEAIKNSTFTGCSSLATISLPKSVRTIDNNPFQGCSSLAEIEVEEGNEHFYAVKGVLFCRDGTLIAFPANKADTEYAIESSVIKIGKYAFRYCLSLKTIVFRDPATLNEIDECAFYYCSLETATIPRSVANIGNYCFSCAESLVSVTFEEGIHIFEIPAYAFWYCSSLVSVNIPDSVTRINKFVFYGCHSLVSISIPNSAAKICEKAFYLCSSLKSIMIPKSVQELGVSVFDSCVSLSEVTFERGVQLAKIPDKAFYRCSSLETVVLPDMITEIGHEAFSGCSLIDTFTISGEAVVKKDTFSDCTSLAFIRMKGNSFICESGAHGQLIVKYVVDKSNCCIAIEDDVGLFNSPFNCESVTGRIGVYRCIRCYYF